MQTVLRGLQVLALWIPFQLNGCNRKYIAIILVLIIVSKARLIYETNQSRNLTCKNICHFAITSLFPLFVDVGVGHNCDNHGYLQRKLQLKHATLQTRNPLDQTPNSSLASQRHLQIVDAHGNRPHTPFHILADCSFQCQNTI